MKSAMILIDLQNDYFPGGKNELCSPEAALRSARQALDRFRNLGLPVFHVQHIADGPNARFFLPGTPGAEIHAGVAPLPGEEVVLKHSPNAFFQTSLSGRLCEKGIGHLVIAGMMSHMCIDTTVRSAKDLGFSVTLLEDACSTKDLHWKGELIPAKTVHAAIMAALNGTFANVTTTEEYLNSTETP